MRVFKNTWFDRFAEREGITDDDLKEAVKLLEADQADAAASPKAMLESIPIGKRPAGTYANLGGGVYKVRVARSGEGKSGGYRVIVFFKSGERTFFAYGFAKSDRGNIDQGELREFKKKAKVDFSLTDEQIRNRLRDKTLIEVFMD